MTSDDLVVIAQIGAPHGVRGWVRVRSFTKPDDNLFDYKVWQLEHQGRQQAFRVETLRRQGQRFIAKLDAIDDRDQAALLTNVDVAVPRSELPELSEDECYWVDLQGLAVFNEKDEQLGTVVDILETGANDVLVIQQEGDKKDILIPYVMGEFVEEIDLDNQKIRVLWDTDF